MGFDVIVGMETIDFVEAELRARGQVVKASDS